MLFSLKNLVFGGFFILEPFGLFSFLQSLLSSPTNPDASTPPQTPLPEEKKEENLPNIKVEMEKKNACAAFLEAHEKRASKIKK